jgi:hypothetical protein
MMATKLNAQVIIKNLQNMHEKPLPPTGARRRMELEYQDRARLHGSGPSFVNVTLVPFLVLAVRCSLSGESPCLAYVAVFMLEISRTGPLLTRHVDSYKRQER